MKIIDALKKGDAGAVLMDENSGVVRLWILSTDNLKDGRTLKALKRFFPHLEIKEELIRLGGYCSVSEAHRALVVAKMTSHSPDVQGLYRFDVPESLATLKTFQREEEEKDSSIKDERVDSVMAEISERQEEARDEVLRERSSRRWETEE